MHIMRQIHTRIITPTATAPYIYILTVFDLFSLGHSGIWLWQSPLNLTIFPLYGWASPSNAFKRDSRSSLSRFLGSMPLTAFRKTSAPPSFSISPSMVIDFRLPGRVLWR